VFLRDEKEKSLFLTGGEKKLEYHIRTWDKKEKKTFRRRKKGTGSTPFSLGGKRKGYMIYRDGGHTFLRRSGKKRRGKERSPNQIDVQEIKKDRPVHLATKKGGP